MATLYPLQFDPIFKERIWGGEKLKSVLNKPIPSKITGESWELSNVPGDVSVISNGFLKGKSLSKAINEYPEAILGKQVFEKFGKEFPLLFKYLDAREDLSIQVHPNDELAKKRHNSFEVMPLPGSISFIRLKKDFLNSLISRIIKRCVRSFSVAARKSADSKTPSDTAPVGDFTL